MLDFIHQGIALLVTLGVPVYVARALCRWHRRFDQLSATVDNAIDNAADAILKGNPHDAWLALDAIFCDGNLDLLMLAPDERDMLQGLCGKLLERLKQEDQDGAQRQLGDLKAAYHAFCAKPTRHIRSCPMEFAKTFFLVK